MPRGLLKTAGFPIAFSDGLGRLAVAGRGQRFESSWDRHSLHSSYFLPVSAAFGVMRAEGVTTVPICHIRIQTELEDTFW